MAAVKGAIDTNVLLRWLLNDIPEQAKRAERLFQSGGSYRVGDMAVVELVYALETGYGYAREDIAGNIRLIFDQKQLVCNRVLIDRAVSMYVAHPKLSFADCALAAEAVLANAAPLYTFDRKLVNQSDGAAVLV